MGGLSDSCKVHLKREMGGGYDCYKEAFRSEALMRYIRCGLIKHKEFMGEYEIQVENELYYKAIGVGIFCKNGWKYYAQTPIFGCAVENPYEYLLKKIEEVILKHKQMPYMERRIREIYGNKQGATAQG